MNTTAWLLISVAIGLIVWDVHAQLRWGYTGTISYDLITAARAYPALPLALGFILGHLFWPQ